MSTAKISRFARMDFLLSPQGMQMYPGYFVDMGEFYRIMNFSTLPHFAYTQNKVFKNFNTLESV